MKCIDLYCGLGGWTDGFLSEGYECIGFDIERHDYGSGGYPGQLVLQDILTVHGSQFRDATCIVASPPCQRYSYMAMPWTKAKALIAWHRESPERIKALNALFDACFRIQYEACQAAGRHIPLIVENVKGAQPWVGRAKANYGSFYLWGDVESVGGRIVRAGALEFGMPAIRAAGRSQAKVGSISWNGYGTPGYKAQAFNRTAEKRLRDGADVSQPATKNNGGSWFAVAQNTESGHGQNPDGRKVQEYSDPRRNGGRGAHLTSPRENSGAKNGNDWFGSGKDCSLQRRASSKSDSRKAASAQIAKIPFPLAQHIARIFKPEGMGERERETVGFSFASTGI